MEEGKTHFLRVIRNNFLGGTSAGCKEQQDAFIRICASSGMIQPSDYLGFFNEQTATDEDGPIWRFIQAAEKLKDNRLMFARAKNVWRDCQKLVNAITVSVQKRGSLCWIAVAANLVIIAAVNVKSLIGPGTNLSVMKWCMTAWP